MESTGKLVVHAALRHFAEGRGEDFPQLLVARPRVLIDEQIKSGGMGELRGLAETTVARVVHSDCGFDDSRNDFRIEVRALAGEALRALDCAYHHRGLLFDIAALL